MKNFIASTFIFFALLLAPAARPALAWSPAVHELTGPALRGMLPQNIPVGGDSFLKGIKDEPELFDDSIKNSKKFTVAFMRSIAVKRFYSKLKLLQSLLSKKTGDRRMAYELGRLSKLTLDMLEPLPDSSSFPIRETATIRSLFIKDADAGRTRYQFVQNGPNIISDFPSALKQIFDSSTFLGGVIYTAYRKGGGYSSIEWQSNEMLNRSINFLADTINTLYASRGAGKSPYFDPRSRLGLDRFKKAPPDSELKIKKPAPPESPDVQSPQEPQENKKTKENENAD